MIKEIETPGGVLGISDDAGYAKIEYYRGKDIAVAVPESIEGKSVTELSKKAFLGAKTITKIELPGSIESIGDFAFASCSALKEVSIAKKKYTLGSGLFRDCVKLEKIVLEGGGESSGSGGDDRETSDIFYLLALAVSKMDAPYLFDPEKAGEKDWIDHFDSVIGQILGRDDSEGFSKMLLCGEEDYVGDESNFDTYCLLKKKEKIRIILIRLLHPMGLSDERRTGFSKYLSENMESAVWPLVLEEHGEEKEYFDILIDTGCINDGNISKLIDSMGERNTQMKGYLIRHKGGSDSGAGFFDGLDL